MSDNIRLHKSDCALLLGGYQCTCGFHQRQNKTPTALSAPKQEHPGYVIGSHWLETAYSRICAGEAEADVLRDIGLVREEAFLTGVAHLKAENEALRRDAERWQHWRDSHGFATIDHEKGRCFVTLICDCDDPDQVRAKRFRGENSFEWLDAFTDAAMENKR